MAKHSFVNSSTLFSILYFLAIVRVVLDEVIGPDIIGNLISQTDARSIIEPEPQLQGLFVRDLQSLAAPDAFEPLVMYNPACRRS